MKRFWPFVAACLLFVGVADCATRDGAAVMRGATSTPPQSPRTTATTTNTTLLSRAGTISRGDMQNTQSVTSRTSSATNSRVGALTSRAALSTGTSASTTGARARAAISTSGTARGATSSRAAAITPTARNTASRHEARTTGPTASRPTIARAALEMDLSQSKTFGTGYMACRDAYFSCMDQFCAVQNESYRRCVCSSRLNDVQARERALSQTATQLQDFVDLNIAVIPNTADEVKAMLTASEGEAAAANAKDTSASAQQLAGISGVLSGTKSKALSTAGTLDIAGNIDAIWSTTEFTSGINLANLSGEALYNAVHAQCIELVAENCTSTATLNMVASAYGMYIENDCSALMNALDKNKVQADSSIRQTERDMNVARLENYDAHNSTSINDCVALVRADITHDAACGTNYIHCLDLSGKYLNRDTGAPIYSPEFYQLDSQISLSGDVLANPENRLFVAELDKKRLNATKSLETCRDLADDVWNEFLRQAIAEIYQGQQERVRQVKDECLDVVNKCYDEQAQKLKDFSNVKEQLLLGARLELSEEMCKQKLDACSNLYGGGSEGLDLLLIAMRKITDQKIAQNCGVTLQEFLTDICTPPTTDSSHQYPYNCRDYTPGDAQYAIIDKCNKDSTITTDGCGDYQGSLYHKLVLYALQACVRPEESTSPIPNHILADVNMVMASIRADMAKELSAECTKMEQDWVDTPWSAETGRTTYTPFYNSTGANKNWGYCAEKSALDITNSGTSDGGTSGDTGSGSDRFPQADLWGPDGP